MRACSDSEGEGGAMPARRSQSVVPAGRRSLAVATASLSISTSNLSEGGRPARAAPALCAQHRPPRVCGRPSCDALHICRLYAAGFCPHGDAACRWGHAVRSECNAAALSAHQLQDMSERELLWVVSVLVRETAPVTADEYRRQLAVCAEYAASDAGCRRTDCFQLHVCARRAAGACGAGDSCRWSHRLTDPANVMVLLRLRCSELSEDEVWRRLAQASRDDTDSDSAGSSRGPADTDSERETADRHQDRTLSSEEGAVGGACSPPKTGAAAASATGHQSAQHPKPGAKQPAQSGERSTGAVAKPAAAKKTPSKQLSKEEMINIAKSLEVCHYYGFPSKCLDKTCGKLHLCRFYVAGMCPYAIIWCLRSHKIADAHNKRVLEQHQLGSLPKTELFKALRAGYMIRNPITMVERHFLVQKCRPYQRGQCQMGVDCTRLHICEGYLDNKCESSTVCGLTHNLNSQHNAEVVRSVGLYSLTAKDVRQILENPIPAQKMWQSSAPKAYQTDEPPEAAAQTSSGNMSNGAEKDSPASASSTGSPKAAAQANEVPQRLEQQTNKPDASQYQGKQQDGRQAAAKSEGTGLAQKTENAAGGAEGASKPDNSAQQSPSGALPKSTAVKSTANVQQTERTSVAKQPQKKSSSASTKVKSSLPKTKEDLMAIARELEVCRDYFYPQKCKKKECNKLHLCRFFVVAKCTYSIYNCLRSHHLWQYPHNARVLERHRLHTLSEQDIFRALRDGYLAQNPVTDVERRFLLQMCRPYQRGHCKRTGVCTRIHICDGYINDKCESNTVCGLTHNLSSEHNAGVARNLGLASLTAMEVKKILKDPIKAKEMWDSSARKRLEGASAAAAAPVGACGGEPAQNSGGATALEPDEAAQATGGASAADTAAGAEAASDSESGSDDSDDESSDLPEDGPVLCGDHACGTRCQRADCEGFHICGFYLANLCRRSDTQCPLGHSFGDPHNVRMMDVFGLLGGSPEHFQELLDQMTLRARISFSNGAEENVSMCLPYNSPGGCASDGACGRFHVCNRFLAGTCKTDCDLSHDLGGEHNRRVREQLEVAPAPGGRHRYCWATDRDIVEMIRAKLGVKPGVYEAPEPVPMLVDQQGSSTAEGAAKTEQETSSSKQELATALGAMKLEEKSCTKETAQQDKADAVAGTNSGPSKTPSQEAKPSNGANSGTPGSNPMPPKPSVPTGPSGAAAAAGTGASLPAVCPSMCAGRKCQNTSCRAVHVCPHFLAAGCRRQRCNLPHRLDTESNQRVLRLVGREVTRENHDALLKELYAAAGNVRRSWVYSKLRICIAHNHVEGCRSRTCPFIHICQRFPGGTCVEKSCPKGHQTFDEGNVKKLRLLKLDTATEEEVLELLRAVHGLRSVC